MSSIDQEILKDAQEDAQVVAFIQARLSDAQKARFTEDVLYYFLDVLEEYYVENGIFDQEPDADGYIDLNVTLIAQHLSEKAQKEGIGTFNPDDLEPVIEAELDFSSEMEA